MFFEVMFRREDSTASSGKYIMSAMNLARFVFPIKARSKKEAGEKAIAAMAKSNPPLVLSSVRRMDREEIVAMQMQQQLQQKQQDAVRQKRLARIAN